MKYVSEQFKEKQDEIIRPATKLVFEVGTNIINSVTSLGGLALDFDNTVAPIVAPKDCTNSYYYAVLGENKQIDDPNRICSPDNSGSIAAPNHSVPYGITPYTAAGSYALIGNASMYFFNFTEITTPITLNFAGGNIPSELVVEKYDPDNASWFAEKTYYNIMLNPEITFEPDNYDDAANQYRRFKVKSSTSGRFQLNWIKGKFSATQTVLPVVFNNNKVVNIDITEETDLTSQSLPTYEMTVTCLDENAEYIPDTEYWDNQFKDGSLCYLKAGYKINGELEYVPILIGKLTEKPDYQHGRITFKVAIDWRIGWTYAIQPTFDDTLNVGDNVPGERFWTFMYNGKLFDSFDVFAYGDDEAASVTSYSGELDSKEVRQLIANALGCFIRAGFNRVDLLNSNSIQYKDFDDYITRYGQVKYTLESKAKVGRISVKRTENLVANDYIDVEALNSAEVGSDSHRWAVFNYEVPFFATGKFEIIDAQSSDPDATISLFTNPESYKLDNGNYNVGMPFTSDLITTIQPIIRFYKTESADFDETENLDESAGEVYENGNYLVTNSYVAGKVKRVAHLVSDISNQYEIDVVQDLRYEVGDIIRLETEKGVYITCVITGLKFNLPGSTGHITCRKMFSFYDSEEAIFEPVGLAVDFGTTDIEVTEASEKACFVGVMNTAFDTYIYVMGVEEYDKTTSGTTTQESYNGLLTDLNGHQWKFAYYSVPSGTQISTSAPVVDLPEYDVSTGVSEDAFGAIALLKSIYAEQGMNAPVDYSCEWEVF